MSLLVLELDQILDRVFIAAPRAEDLKGLFESLTFEITTELAPNEDCKLATAALQQGPFRYACSFTLGQRARASVRPILMGMTFGDLTANPELLGATDALFVWVPPKAVGAEELLRLKVPSDRRSCPVVTAGIIGTDFNEGSPTAFKKLAALEFLKRNFTQTRHLASEERFLRDGLEWVLSFEGSLG